jgi:hypothetical protein
MLGDAFPYRALNYFPIKKEENKQDVPLFLNFFGSLETLAPTSSICAWVCCSRLSLVMLEGGAGGPPPGAVPSASLVGS